jgi:hypothetical protein
MSYKIKYKGLDNEPIPHITKYLEASGWSVWNVENGVIEYLNFLKNKMLIVYHIRNEIASREVKITQHADDESISYVKVIPILNEILRYFDGLDYEVDELQHLETGQTIYDWYDGM